jgi:hypothetical protein
VVTNTENGVTLSGTFSGNGSGLTSVLAAGLTGTISVTNLPGAVVTNNESGVTLSGTFSGNGSGLSLVPAGSLTGTVPVPDLPGAVVTNTETGVTLSGTFSGNGSGLSLLSAGGLTGTVSLANLPAAVVTNNDVGVTLSGTFKGNGGELSSVVASGLTGVISITNLPAAAVTNNETGVTLAGAFSGDGSGLSLSPDVALLDAANQSFTGTNSFGMVVIGAGTPSARLSLGSDPSATKLAVWDGGTNNTMGFGVGAGQFRISIPNNANRFSFLNQPSGGTEVFTVTGNGYVGIGVTNPTAPLVVSGGAYCNGTTWENGSDRNSKKDFAPVDAETILAKVSALPITQWQYKVDATGGRHIGPMAQDFHAAFGLNGADGTHISTVDEGGVALAAIQGLNQRLAAKDAEIAELKARVADLAELKARLEKLERLWDEKGATNRP